MRINNPLYSILIAGALLTGGAPDVKEAHAQVSATPIRFAPDISGSLERARIMCGAGNYLGVTDQLRGIGPVINQLTEAEAEQYCYLLARAWYGMGSEESLAMLRRCVELFPASPEAPEAMMAIGDYYFFKHEWPDALAAYQDTDGARLNPTLRQLYNYRKALAMIRTGYFEEARPFVESLPQNDEYGNARTFYLAYLDYIDGNFNRAYTGFQAVKTGERGLEAGYYMTQIEYSRGQYQDVIKHGNSLLRKHPVPELCAEIHRIVGLSYFKTGNPDVAEGYFVNYLDQNGEENASRDALYALAAIEYGSGRYQEALRHLESLTELEDAIGQGAWLYTGLCYLQLNDPSAATLAFERASRMQCDRDVTEAALYNYISSLTRGGKVPFSSAARQLEAFVEHYPNSEYAADVRSYLASAYYNDRQYLKALQYIEEIAHPDAKQLGVKQRVLYQLGIEAATNGQYDKAASYLQRAVDIKEGDKKLTTQARLWLGDSLYALGRYKEAEKNYTDFLKDGKGDENKALGLYNLAYTQYKEGAYGEAALNFAAAIKARPALDTPQLNDARIREADCLYYTGRYVEAAKLYSEAIENDAADSDYALYRRAVMHGLAGNTSQKIEDLNRLYSHYPESRWLSKAMLELAETYENIGRNDLAAEAYQRRLKASPEDVDIDELIRMSRTMHDAGKWDSLLEVTSRLKQAGGLEADELSEISLYEADALAQKGRWHEAMELYTDLARNPSSLPGAKATVMLAEGELKAKDYESARRRMEKFTDIGTPHQYWLARGFITLADAYYALGQQNLAKEYLISLRDNYPGTGDDINTRISQRLNKWK